MTDIDFLFLFILIVWAWPKASLLAYKKSTRWWIDYGLKKPIIVLLSIKSFLLLSYIPRYITATSVEILKQREEKRYLFTTACLCVYIYMVPGVSFKSGWTSTLETKPFTEACMKLNAPRQSPHWGMTVEVRRTQTVGVEPWFHKGCSPGEWGPCSENTSRDALWGHLEIERAVRFSWCRCAKGTALYGKQGFFTPWDSNSYYSKSVWVFRYSAVASDGEASKTKMCWGITNDIKANEAVNEICDCIKESTTCFSSLFSRSESNSTKEILGLI